MDYELKDKINVTEELIAELESRGWQEIEYLQNQIANISDSPINNKLRQLFKNLLTSYYVFVGGIESLADKPTNYVDDQLEVPVEEIQAEEVQIIPEKSNTEFQNTDEFLVNVKANSLEVNEPFEYFVDFDEPTGEPLTDEDLYNN